MAAPVDARRQVPMMLENSWIYLSTGVSKAFFQTSDFATGYQFNEQRDAIVAMRLSIGHYFNPYLALSVSLMRGIHSNKFSNAQSVFPLTSEEATAQYSVTNNLFTLALRPALPLGRGLSMYGEGGLGYISRKGFSINQDGVVNNANFVTGIVGAGVNYELPSGVTLGLDSEYTPPVQSQKQPAIFYVGVGVGYVSRPEGKKVVTASDSYDFPLNLLQMNYMNQSIFYAEVAKYFTTPYIPIFFNGRIKVGEGLEFLYERNFFHTDKNFSIEWGVSAAQWQSQGLKQDFYTISLFPELKIWMVRSPRFDFYFEYSLAGPSYLSRVYIDGLDSGSHFTFQDFLGIGALAGSHKHVNINLRIVHFSNGNTLPINTGLAVPVMFGIGYAW